MPALKGFDLQRIIDASSKHVKPASFQPAYGTAGFRSEASLLASTVFRCGLLTAARSVVTGQACGLMITASHNPEPDNGVKLVEPDGGMLIAAWEPLATELACAADDQQVAQLLQRLLASHDVQLLPADQPGDSTEQPGSSSSSSSSSSALVVLGCDTRPSAPGLVAAARAGAEALGARVLDLGQVTTPQLHFQVVAINSGQPQPAAATAAAPSMDAYFETLLGGFEELVSSCATAATPESAASVTLHVDCANGVGAAQLEVVCKRLAAGSSNTTAAAGGALLHLELLNTGAGQLNHQCGADYVQKEVVAPNAFDNLPEDARCCSIDGDADRLVYFQLHAQPQGAARPISLLDGDKIAALAASLLKELVAGLPADLAAGIKMGVVQTAYANGASTHYLQHSLGLAVVCTKTGVKHLHPAAHAFDIGIYFEANGHGTVLFAPSLLQRLQQASSHSAAARQLLAVSRCVNQAVGDALSGILLVESALRLRGWGLQQWQDMYTDLPSRQRKLVVKDRGVLASSDPAERRVSAPVGLQEAIDTLVAAAGPQARAFVRASGTEDAVRVYAEAGNQQAADTLALQVAQAVHELAGGVGARPSQ